MERRSVASQAKAEEWRDDRNTRWTIRSDPARAVEADVVVRVDLRIPAWIVRELMIRPSQGGQFRDAYLEELRQTRLRQDRGDSGRPASLDGPRS